MFLNRYMVKEVVIVITEYYLEINNNKLLNNLIIWMNFQIVMFSVRSQFEGYIFYEYVYILFLELYNYRNGEKK